MSDNLSATPIYSGIRDAYRVGRNKAFDLALRVVDDCGMRNYANPQDAIRDIRLSIEKLKEANR